MSIYIKGMQTPVAGQCIEFAEDQNGDLYARLSPSFDDWHEVVSLPAHGRLVDADSLLERIEFEVRYYNIQDEFDKGRAAGWNNVIRAIREYTPTIIQEDDKA